MAGSVREQVKDTFDGNELEKTLEDIEIFLSVFQGDKNIEKASVELLVAVLAAVEGTIGFFLSHQGKIPHTKRFYISDANISPNHSHLLQLKESQKL